MKGIQLFAVLAILSCLIGGCRYERESSHDAVAVCRRASGCLKDKVRLSRLTDQAVKLKEAGATAKGERLREQLKRTFQPVSLSPVSLQKKTPSEVYKECKRSVVVIGGLYKCNECTKWHCETATGFIISSSGVLVTNYHVVANKNIQGYAVMTDDGEFYGVKEVLAADRANDIAVLQINGSGFQPLALSGHEEVGATVTLISHPDNHYYMLTEGIISRYMTEMMHGAEVERLQITADFARGSSGGPVLNEYGNVVGMVRATESIYYHETKEVQENLQMVVKTCVPADAILALVKEAPSKSEKRSSAAE